MSSFRLSLVGNSRAAIMFQLL